jgi:hypothetical protein
MSNLAERAKSFPKIREMYLAIDWVEGGHRIADHAQAIRHADLLIPPPEVVRALVCSGKGKDINFKKASAFLCR